MESPRRPLAALLLLLAVFALPGCELIFLSQVKLRIDGIATDPQDPKSPLDRFVSWQGRRRFDPDCLASFDKSRCPVGTVVAPFELHTPFVVGASAGLFDPERLAESENARYCIEVDDVGDPSPAFGTTFWFVCGLYTQGGTQVFAGDSAGSIDSNTAQRFYPGETRVELQIENDGALWTIRSRAAGAALHDTLASVAHSAPAGRLLPSFGTVNLFKQGVVGFDDFQLESGDPASPTLDQVYAGYLQESLRHQDAACNALDGATPDFLSAEASLGDAFGSLAIARTILPMLPEGKERSKADKWLRRSEKQLDRAIGRIPRLREIPVLRKIQRSMRMQTDALQLVRPVLIDFAD